ncbi:MAG: M24 family metallopeptidase [Dehalobacterium sp.]
MNSRKLEIDKKVVCLSGLREELKLDGIYLAKAMNFSWLTAGGCDRVVTGSDTGPAAILLMGEKKYVLAPRNEIDRFMDEEVLGLGFEPVTFDWYASKEKILLDLVGKKKVAVDHPMGNLPVLGRELNRLRFSLTEEEVERAKKIGAVSSEVLAEACRNLTPGQTEQEIEGEIAGELLASGIKPAVLLVGTDERPFKYRHPIPTVKKFNNYAVVGVVAEQGGLHLALTRTVSIGKVGDDIQKLYQSTLKVQAAYLSASQPGTNTDAIFKQGCLAYANEGFPDEWQRHHQGGAIGYAPREYRIGEGAAEVVEVNQMLAWNPTILGTKCEDTVLTNQNGKLDFLTFVPDWWPKEEILSEGYSFTLPSILVLD